MYRISEGAKRDIQDLFVCGITLPDGSTRKVFWFGRLDEVGFLSRLYNLSQLPSYDHRYNNAEGDIRCHTGWEDWEEDWVFTDSRFNLLHAEDEVFLRFLCEVFHPVVTKNSVEDYSSPEMYLLKEIQEIIRSEGYELYETKRIANKPVYSWREVGAMHTTQQRVEALKQVFTSEHLRKQIDQMEASVESNPGDAIGKAKELIESCCKTILEKEKVVVDDAWGIPRLIKETTSVLKLMPDRVQNPSVEDATKKLIGNLSQISFQLATIRNKMGSGHGKSDSFTGLESRHAKLAVGSAATLSWFLWESYQNHL